MAGSLDLRFMIKMEVKEEEIKRLLDEVAREYDVKILFCVESGSRAWGMESNDSNYDVRFVFYRNPKEYTLINPKSDVINAAFNEKLERCAPEGCLVDMQGFDLIKFSKMLDMGMGHSGTKNTIRYARELGKEIFIISSQNTGKARSEQ